MDTQGTDSEPIPERVRLAAAIDRADVPVLPGEGGGRGRLMGTGTGMQASSGEITMTIDEKWFERIGHAALLVSSALIAANPTKYGWLSPVVTGLGQMMQQPR